MSDSTGLGELTPREYALLTPEALGGLKEYRSFCRATGPPPEPGGYGLLFCEGPKGTHVTVATKDLDYWRMIREGTGGPDTLAGLKIPAGKFPWRIPGWPDDWAAAAR